MIVVTIIITAILINLIIVTIRFKLLIDVNIDNKSEEFNESEVLNSDMI